MKRDRLVRRELSSDDRGYQQSGFLHLAGSYIAYSYGSFASFFRLPTFMRRTNDFLDIEEGNAFKAQAAGAVTGLASIIGLTAFCVKRELAGDFMPAQILGGAIIAGNALSGVFELGYKLWKRR